MATIPNATAALVCPVCVAYRERRAASIAIWSVIIGESHGVSPLPLALRYLGSVHTRHLAGGCLSTRKRTPVRRVDGVDRITVHRICNGCGTDVGDANATELDAALDGRPLPDVRLECGCLGRDERAA